VSNSHVSIYYLFGATIKLESKHGLVIIVVLAVGVIVWNFLELSTFHVAGDRSGGKGSRGSDMSGFRAVFVTVPSIEVGKKIAHALVSSKLAACVNIIPQITSVYEWEGKIEEDSELLLMIKTQTQHFDELAKLVKDNHPYTTPEVIGIPIEQGSQPYLDWIKSVTTKEKTSVGGDNSNN
jgi:periplasmic divalent cation tolerance protein